MVVTIEPAELGDALKLTSPDVEEIATLTRLVAVAAAHAERWAPNAPEAILNEAVIRMAGYLYDSPTAHAGNYAGAFSRSGAEAVLAPWRNHRAGVLGGGPAAAAIPEHEHALPPHEHEAAPREAAEPYEPPEPVLLGSFTIPANALNETGGSFDLEHDIPDRARLDLQIEDVGGRLIVGEFSGGAFNRAVAADVELQLRISRAFGTSFAHSQAYVTGGTMDGTPFMRLRFSHTLSIRGATVRVYMTV